MSETSTPNPLRQLRFTPMRDIIRGKLTGRLDLNHRIETSVLPIPAKTLIQNVVHRTRLLRSEKIDVATDLIAHFHDGLETGASIDHLIESFGDPKIAAKLIRRAKKRARSLRLQLFIAFCRLTLALILFYICLGLYFFSGTPSVKVNYIAQLNQITDQTPADQRAWPLYRQAKLALGDQSAAAKNNWPNIWQRHLSPAAIAWLRQNTTALDLARQGAAKPILGHILSPNIPKEDRPLWPDDAGILTDRSNEDLLSATSGMYLNILSYLRGLLSADARLARADGDRTRFLQDIQALENMAQQNHDNVNAYMYSVALFPRFAAIDAIDEALNQSPQLFTDDDLQQLAHRLSIPHSAADLIDFHAADLSTLDAIQHMYTQNTFGNGRITPDGFRFATRVYSNANVGQTRDPVVKALVWPAIMLDMPSRTTALNEFQSAVQSRDARFQLPYRQANWKPFHDQQQARDQTPLQQFIHFPEALMQWVPNIHQSAERYLAYRDGVVVAIALEAYHRKNHHYPDSLTALVPNLLPSIPADRITGEPLHYRLIDNKPIVYSVGTNRLDDGGQPTLDKQGKPQTGLAMRWDCPPNEVVPGDWVLYPASAIVEDDDAN